MKKLPFFIFLSIAFLIVGSFPFAVKKVSVSNKKPEKQGYSAIIEVWQLDMFEGGTGSRRNYLSGTAKEFEKRNCGVVVSVISLTKFSAEEKMKQGIYPDVISYSPGLNGVECKMLPLGKADSYGGCYGKKSYAVAWAVGGYALYNKKNVKADTLIISQGEYTQPLIAYYLSGLNFSNVVIKKPKEAYTDFITKNNCALLSTQRDAFRLKSKNVEFEAQPVSDFSDLVQYVSVTSDGEKTEISKKFVSFLLENGKNLESSIGLMPPCGMTVNSADSPINFFYGYKPEKTLSVFTSPQALKEMQNYLGDNALSREEKMIRIKNLLQ